MQAMVEGYLMRRQIAQGGTVTAYTADPAPPLPLETCPGVLLALVLPAASCPGVVPATQAPFVIPTTSYVTATTPGQVSLPTAGS